MTEGVLIGILTGGFVLAGVLITQLFEVWKRKSEERRWYADRFLGKKIDALSNLYASMVGCYNTMEYYASNAPHTRQEFEEKIESSVTVYEQSIAIASIYADEGTKIGVETLRCLFAGMKTFILASLPKDQKPANITPAVYSPEWKKLKLEELTEKYEKVRFRIRSALNPKLFESIEGKK